MNKVISREYVEQNYIHKDIIREILEKHGKRPMTDENVVKFYKSLKKLVEETKDVN